MLLDSKVGLDSGRVRSDRWINQVFQLGPELLYPARLSPEKGLNEWTLTFYCRSEVELGQIFSCRAVKGQA